jgi:hypothetical protein
MTTDWHPPEISPVRSVPGLFQSCERETRGMHPHLELEGPGRLVLTSYI